MTLRGIQARDIKPGQWLLADVAISHGRLLEVAGGWLSGYCNLVTVQCKAIDGREPTYTMHPDESVVVGEMEAAQ